MSAIPLDVATALAGGEWFSGLSVALAAQMFWRHGACFEIINDKKRQILLNFICLVCALNTTISYGFNATQQSVVVSDVTTIITFSCIQFALVILNHNTLVRASNLVRMSMMSRETADKVARSLYFLPFVVMIPVYLSFAETFGTGQPLNTSRYNAYVFKPLNICLLVATETFATTTDVLLLLKVRSITAKLGVASAWPGQAAESSSSSGEKSQVGNVASKAMELASADLWGSYALVWTLTIVDVSVKALIAAGLPLRFDSIITIATVALRSRANLQYGLELQALTQHSRHPSQRKPSSQGSTSSSASSTAGSTYLE